MCLNKSNHLVVAVEPTTTTSASDGGYQDWRQQCINGGQLPHVDLETGTNGWASPPGNLFSLRGETYLANRTHKSPSGEWLLDPAGVDWLRSTSKLYHVLSRPDNRVLCSLRRKSIKPFLLAVNLQIPGGRDNYSVVSYFSTDDPIPTGSLLHRFVHGDDAFRNQRFKLVNRIVRGPWMVKAAVGNRAGCLLGKALTCRYYRGENYLEIDVDIGSNAVANAVSRLALKYVAALSIDMGFLIEGQTREELPERLLGGVRLAHLETSSALFVEGGNDGAQLSSQSSFSKNLSKVSHHNGGSDQRDDGEEK